MEEILLCHVLSTITMEIDHGRVEAFGKRANCSLLGEAFFRALRLMS